MKIYMADPVKKALRDIMKHTRANTSASYCATASNQICTRIRSLTQYRAANRIALYCATKSEINVDELWQSAWLQGKECYFPVINEKELTLSFLPAIPTTPFKKNRYEIAEPDVSHDLAIPIEQLDLVLIPLVAFDVCCARLGMGSGYYDRTFKDNEHCTLFGIGYQFQRVDHLKQEPWDVQLHAVITQRAIYWHNG